jgi:adenylyltransferase/sulfurtransferase
MSIHAEMNDQQLLQYNRQIMLPQIDVSGQQKLLNASVAVLGAGGLGCPALQYLVASGVGEIHLIDHDVVELSNLQRQILFRTIDVGRKKVVVAKESLATLNSQTKVITYEQLPDENELGHIIDKVDVVLDGTDNFASRYRHNNVCIQTKTPLVAGAVIRFEGQVCCFLNHDVNEPCYQCIYPDAVDENENCTENGVLGSVAGIVGSIMATEAIKIIINIGAPLANRLLLLDALQQEWRSLKIIQDASCIACKMKRK